MKITTDLNWSSNDEGAVGALVIGEVFSGAYIETSEGNRIGFCLRDDTVEFNIIPKDSDKTRWYRANMQTLEMEEMEAAKTGLSSEELRTRAHQLTDAIIAELEAHHIQFEGRLTHTGRDIVTEVVVEPFLRRLIDPKTDPKGGSG